MKQKLWIALTLTLFVSVAAFGGPISSCTGANGSIVCNLYETDALGNPSEVGWAVPLNGPVGVGLVGLTDGTGISDILTFTAFSVQLTSGEGLLCPFCYLIAENPNGPTEYNVGNVYFVFSDPETPSVPEPPSLILLGSGILGMVIAGRLKLRRSALHASHPSVTPLCPS